MRPGLLFVALTCGGASVAVPVEQRPLTGNGHRAGPHRNPYTPDYRDPYDGRVDSVGEKLHPLPYVRFYQH